MPEAGAGRVGRIEEGTEQKKKAHISDKKVVRKSSQVKRKAVEQPGDVEKRNTDMFKTMLSKRLLELSENSTGEEGSSGLKNVVKRSVVKQGSQKRINLVKSMNKVDTQETQNFNTILCSEAGCGKKFKSSSGFLYHRRKVHLGETSLVKLHKCEKDNCDSYFGQREKLDNHMRKTHGYPMLVCDEAECEEKFYSSDGLRKHYKKKH